MQYSRTATPYPSIHSVLICWDGTQAQADIDEIKDLGHELRRAGKEITFLAYYPMKKLGPDMQSNALHQLICRSDFNFFKAPKSQSLKEICNTPYDLLINACLDGNEFLNTIAVFSKAKFRIGPFINNEDTYFYELLIKPNGADPCKNYLVEIGRSLQKIK